MSTQLEELRKEADELGVQYGKTLGESKLKDKIDAFYDSQETSGAVVQAAVQEQEQAEAKISEKKEKVLSATEQRAQIRVGRERAARATQVVTIVDNDQRVNNHTTTCTASCSNEYFDLGTVRLPLNERIEVCTGHIRTLQDVSIPMHVRDTKTGLATVRMRPRYAISFG